MDKSFKILWIFIHLTKGDVLMGSWGSCIQRRNPPFWVTAESENVCVILRCGAHCEETIKNIKLMCERDKSS